MADQHGFQPVTSIDHRAWLWTVSILSMIYSFLCLCARVTGKWELLWWDDGILGLAYVSALVHFGTLFKALSVGLGASTLVVSSAQIGVASEQYFVSRIFGIIALCLSKVSVLVFARRIFSGNLDKENIYFAVAYACVGIYGVGSVLLSSADCRPGNALLPDVNAVCDANVARWAVITALDVFTEIILFVLPVWFISKNQIKSSKKRVVVFVFSFRMIVAAFSIVTLTTYISFLRGTGVSIGAAPTVAWQEVLIGFSLISASIPCLRSFLWAFMSTGLMTVYGNNTTNGGSQSASNQVRSQHRSAIASHNRDEGSRNLSSRLRPEWLEYKVDVRSQPRDKKSSGHNAHGESASLASDGSEQMIIHRNVDIDVEHTDGRV